MKLNKWLIAIISFSASVFVVPHILIFGARLTGTKLDAIAVQMFFLLSVMMGSTITVAMILELIPKDRDD